MKVSEAIRECMYYPYSREHYELTEMSYRISLMEQFIESQLFISDISNQTEAIMYEGGMYGDRISDELLESVILEAGDNKVTLWDKIQMGMTKMIQWIKDLFFKIALRFDKSLKLARELVSTLKDKKIDKELWNKLNKACLDAMEGDAVSFQPWEEQPFSLELHYLNDVPANDQKALTARLAAAVSDTQVKADPRKITQIEENNDKKKNDKKKNDKKKDDGKAYIGFVAPPLTIINKIYDFVKGDSTNVDSVLNDLKTDAEKANKEGLEIEVNPKVVEDLANRLAKISYRLETIQKKKGGSSSSDNSDNKEEANTESYWYDFYPEYLYEGCYDDWDPIYGDPYMDLIEVFENTQKQNKQSNQGKKKKQRSAEEIDITNKTQSLWDTWKTTVLPMKERNQYSKFNARRSALLEEIKNLEAEAKSKNVNIKNLGDLRKAVEQNGAVDVHSLQSSNEETVNDVKDKISQLDNLKRRGLNVEYNDTLMAIRDGLEKIKQNGGYTGLGRNVWKYADENKYPLLDTSKRSTQSGEKIIEGIRTEVVALRKLENGGESTRDEYNEKLKEVQDKIREARNQTSGGDRDKLMGKVYQDILDTKPRKAAKDNSKKNTDIITQDMRDQLREVVDLLSAKDWETVFRVIITGDSESKGKIFSQQRRQLKKQLSTRQKTCNIYVDIQDKLKKNGGLKLSELPDFERRAMISVGDTLRDYQVIRNEYNEKLGKPPEYPDVSKDGPAKSLGSNAASSIDDHHILVSNIDTKGLNKSYAVLKTYIGTTMKIYLGYAHYRTKAMDGISDVLNLNSSGSDDSNDDNKEEAS